MRLSRASVILLAMTVARVPAQSQANVSTTQDVKVDRAGLIANYVSPFQAIVRIGIENRVPIGIVFGSRPFLCTETATVKVEAANFGEAFSQALAGTGYSVQTVDGAYVFFAPDVTAHEKRQLSFRFDKFSAPNATLKEAGSLLGGYVMMLVDGAEGFAGDSPFRLSARRFNIQMQSATTIQIANHIVSLDGKGIWVFRPTEEKSVADVKPSIEVYGYEENGAEVGNLRCDTARRK